jgi:streptogramin lyase
VWSAGITTDRVQRLDPRTGLFTEYLLPRYSSLRRFAFENSGNRVTFWAPNKNSASILRVEPFDHESEGD